MHLEEKRKTKLKFIVIQQELADKLSSSLQDGFQTPHLFTPATFSPVSPSGLVSLDGRCF